MNNFNNNAYQTLVTDLIGDSFYTDTSYRGKISTVRQYAEVIVRKILDIDPDASLTLGKIDIQNRLRNLPNYAFIENAVNEVRVNGNLCTHTQNRDEITSESFDRIVDSLFDMLSFLLINYFEKYEFGKRGDVLSAFSLLPPIIRYKVLVFLHNKYPDNISVIDKLVLATMKAISVDEAYRWVETNKSTLIRLKTVSDQAINSMIDRYGVQIANIILSASSPNMYALCKEKIDLLGPTINENGPVYSDFESALPYYKAKGILHGDDPETAEFNDIMDFLYLGRKQQLINVSVNPVIVLY